MKGSGRAPPCSCGLGDSGRRHVRSSESMRFAASRLPNRLTSVGSSEAVIQSSAPSTPEQLHAEHGAGRRRAGTEVGDTRRGAVEREDAVSSDVEFHASAAPPSRKRPHGLMRRTPHSCQIRKVPHAPTGDASADTRRFARVPESQHRAVRCRGPMGATYAETMGRVALV